MTLSLRRAPDQLHPLAWWVWAAGLATAAWATTNPLLLILIAGVATLVTYLRRGEESWSGALRIALRMALVVIVIRVGLEIIFGARTGGTPLFTLPSVALPSWAAGVSIGGPVTASSMLAALYLGMQLATVLICFGAVNSLASPYRMIRNLPAVFFEAGVALSVSLSFTPAASETAAEIRTMRQIRGRPTRGVSALKGMAVPILEGTLEGAIGLAASMDARGFGRRAQGGSGSRLPDLALAVGLASAGVGVFAVLDQVSGPMAPLCLLVAAGGLGWGLMAKGRQASRTRYRPAGWTITEWALLAAMVTLATLFSLHLETLHPVGQTVTRPGLPAWYVPVLLLAACPLALVTPPAEEPTELEDEE